MTETSLTAQPLPVQLYRIELCRIKGSGCLTRQWFPCKVTIVPSRVSLVTGRRQRSSDGTLNFWSNAHSFYLHCWTQRSPTRHLPLLTASPCHSRWSVGRAGSPLPIPLRPC